MPGLQARRCAACSPPRRPPGYRHAVSLNPDASTSWVSGAMSAYVPGVTRRPEGGRVGSRLRRAAGSRQPAGGWQRSDAAPPHPATELAWTARRLPLSPVDRRSRARRPAPRPALTQNHGRGDELRFDPLAAPPRAYRHDAQSQPTARGALARRCAPSAEHWPARITGSHALRTSSQRRGAGSDLAAHRSRWIAGCASPTSVDAESRTPHGGRATTPSSATGGGAGIRLAVPNPDHGSPAIRLWSSVIRNR
jgi:hypothetical protein